MPMPTMNFHFLPCISVSCAGTGGLSLRQLELFSLGNPNGILHLLWPIVNEKDCGEIEADQFEFAFFASLGQEPATGDFMNRGNLLAGQLSNSSRHCRPGLQVAAVPYKGAIHARQTLD
jgi:hypothetical protein